jgi:[protein-PII] uridylyltransferase
MALHKTAVLDIKAFERALAAIGPDNKAGALALFRDTLRVGRTALKQSYFEGEHAPTLLSLHAWLVDQLLIHAWRWHGALLPPKLAVALVAVGGYGRGELYPASDIDLMLLLEKGEPKRIHQFAGAFLQFLWDMGLEVGHSVRALKDCVREAKKDITVATNLMEARRLTGDAALFNAMRRKTGPKRIWPSKKFFAAKHREQMQRHHHFHDTAYNLEPNIKEGPGGLRDIQMVGWVAQRHFGVETLHALVEKQFLSEAEYRELQSGQALLARVRCGLHYLAEHREDRLLFDHQRALARQFGYWDKPGSLAVEQFMKEYYRCVKTLALLNEILLQHFQEAVLKLRRFGRKRINERFEARAGFLDVTDDRLFEQHPQAMLELFLILQRHPKLKGVRAHTMRLVRANVARIGAEFRRDPRCRGLFMDILREPRGVTHALRRMNAYGLLGAYLPAFGKIVGQMQHDLFHVYTVDEHILFVLRNLRRFMMPEYSNEFPLASRLIHPLARPERLYLAALFHDIAKGRGGDHSELGEDDARAFCRQHGLSDYDTGLVCWLVRYHLLMSNVAQRQDIFDPEVVTDFARRVGDQEHLDCLYLLTVADMRGTSPAIWNVWKDRLLTQLYSAASRALARGFATPLDVKQYIADIQNGALALLKDSSVTLDAVKDHWQQLGDEYFLRHNAETIAWHAQHIAATQAAQLPLVATRYHPEAGGTEFLIYTPDRDGLFAILTGGFDRLNLSIADARIHTTRNGFALDTFVALDHAAQAITDTKALATLQKVMHAQLLDPHPGRDPRGAQLPRQLKHFPIDTKVSFSPSANGQQTLMEVVAQDRPGLLYQVALALQHCRANLVAAKVSTYGERAEDIFFLTTHDRRPLGDAAQLKCLENEIVRRLTPNQVNEPRAIEI